MPIMNFKTVNHWGPGFIFETKGTESKQGVFEMKIGNMTTYSEDADVINNLATEESLIADMNYQRRKNLDNSGFSESSLTPLGESFEEQNIKAKSFNNETKLVGVFDSLEEIDQEETELDVESVLAKQNTHDLYCPKCKICITRRVILRRKSNPDEDAAFPAVLDDDSTNSANVEVPVNDDVHPTDSPAFAASDLNNDGEPEKCLSCLNFLIPIGDAIKLSWPIGNANGQNPPKTPPTNSTNDKNKSTAEPASPNVGGASSNAAINVNPASPNVVGASRNVAVNVNPASPNVVGASRNVAVNVNPASPNVVGASSNAAVNVNLASPNVVGASSNAVVNVNPASPNVVGASSNAAVNVYPASPNVVGASSNVAVNVSADPAASQIQTGVTVDILKSIVYGGLIESITSLGVVSSAAGAGSATLNILALGLANLIGGLFIIGNNLIELKNYTSDSTDQINRHEDRYKETLGRPENFPLHATVAVLSFLIFGMLSPIIYSFSFRKSDDKDLKLAVVGGVSLVCILLLAIGKAHVRRPPKSYYISTALSYVISGIMASGISYVVGDLISKLLEKVGWFESSLVVSTIVPERKPIELAWASY